MEYVTHKSIIRFDETKGMSKENVILKLVEFWLRKIGRQA